MSDTNFWIECVSAGGPLGHRVSELKSNGKVQWFATQEAASGHAARLNKQMNTPFSLGTITYTVKTESEW